MTVLEAAEHLMVHQSRVRELLSAGTLMGRRVGRQWLINRDDLDRHQNLVRSGANSRAMSTRTAWAAGAMLDGQRTPWLATSERARLKRRLLDHTDQPQAFRRWLLTRQQSVDHYRIADADLGGLLHEDGVVATGVSTTRPYRLGLGAPTEGDVYADEDALRRLIRAYFLIQSDRGNLTVRTVHGSWHTDTATARAGALVTTRLVVAVDLLEQDDTRSVNAGRRLLADVLQEFAQAATNAGLTGAAK